MLSRNEGKFLSRLLDWSGRESGALRFVWQVLTSRPAIAGVYQPTNWRVPSATTEGRFYEVDIEWRWCNCIGFAFRHRCSHLEVADRAAWLSYQLVHEATGAFLQPPLAMRDRVGLREKACGVDDGAGPDLKSKRAAYALWHSFQKPVNSRP